MTSQQRTFCMGAILHCYQYNGIACAFPGSSAISRNLRRDILWGAGIDEPAAIMTASSTKQTASWARPYRLESFQVLPRLLRTSWFAFSKMYKPAARAIFELIKKSGCNFCLVPWSNPEKTNDIGSRHDWHLRMRVLRNRILFIHWRLGTL